MSVETDSLGRPLHDLRISVTDKCNMRCTYCMPQDRYGEHYAFLRRDELLSFEEITRVVHAAANLGVRKLRVTGGEPLLRKELPALIEMVAGVPGIDDFAMTTNGLLLPKFAPTLRAAGLQRITISLDTLDEAVFALMSGGRGSVAGVLEGIAAAESAGFDAIKINCVVQRGVNDEGVVALAEHFRHTGHIVRFIEYMDVGTCNLWKPGEVVPSVAIRNRIHARYPIRPLDPEYHGEVASRYAYEDGAGEIGFISSISEPFCGDCSRLRLSADGSLYTCLFATQGVDLRNPLRAGATDEDLQTILRTVWKQRTDRYSERRADLRRTRAADHKIEMYHIGG